LAFDQCCDPGGFDVVDMHKNIGAAIIRQDEAKPAICAEAGGRNFRTGGGKVVSMEGPPPPKRVAITP